MSFFFYDTVIRTQHTTLWKNLTRNFIISLLSPTCILFSLSLKLSFMLTELLENHNFYRSYWWMKLTLMNSLQARVFSSLSMKHMTTQLQLIVNIKLLGILLNVLNLLLLEFKNYLFKPGRKGRIFKVMTIWM